jgi:hypothetical protein
MHLLSSPVYVHTTVQLVQFVTKDLHYSMCKHKQRAVFAVMVLLTLYAMLLWYPNYYFTAIATVYS